MAENTDTTQKSPVCDDSLNADGPLPTALAQELRSMHEWIYSYVSENLHHAAPLDEFTEKLMVRMRGMLSRNPSCGPRMAITNSVRDLVHDLNRTAIRRQARFLTRPVFDDLIDERENIESSLLDESQRAWAIALLNRLKDKDRELVEQVYGLHGCEVDRQQIALQRGVLRNSIDQQLRRIFKSIRDSLGT